MPPRSRFAVSLAAFLFAVLTVTLPAHEPGLSTGVIRLTPDAAFSQLTFAWQDAALLTPLDTNDDGELGADEIAAAREKLTEIAGRSLELRADDSPVTPSSFRSFVDETNNVHFEAEFPLRGPDTLSIFSPLIDRMPPNHRQYVVLYDETNAPLAEVLLSADEDVMDIDLHALFPPRTFNDFFKLGLEHIVTGYDHLLFLLGLLLVTTRFRTAAVIITSFTVAHSLTLALATFEVVNLDGAVVEPLIAASIVYVGAENLFFRESPKWRGWLTFAFGLVHGLGFAGLLKELGIGAAGGVAVPLLSFNLGVEAGQLAIAAIALPVLFALRRWPAYAKWGAPAGSVLVALLGLWWLIERTLL
jgi:hydrogenase/urease accessory protein HupE